MEETFIVHESVVTESPSRMFFRSEDKINYYADTNSSNSGSNDGNQSVPYKINKIQNCVRVIPQSCNKLQQFKFVGQENKDYNRIRPQTQRECLDSNQTTKMLNSTIAKYQYGFQTDQTKILQTSEYSSFVQIGRRSRKEKENLKQHQKQKRLLKMLTVDLKETYNNISKRSHSQSQSSSCDNSLMKLIVKDSILNNRYKVIKVIGKGAFGVVIKANDIKNQKTVAIKIMMNSKHYKEQAQREIETLKFLNKIDHDKGFIVRLLSTFKLNKKYQCMVFEQLEMNLLELLYSIKDPKDSTKNLGLSLEFVKIIGCQILVALCLLSMSNVSIIHSDLKPENVMLKEKGRTGIKLIDFGNACSTKSKICKYVQSRYYRSPEVIMEIPYSNQIDTWSLGCILFELHFGEVLFQGNGNSKLDQLFAIIDAKGELPPEQMLTSSIYQQEILEYAKDKRNYESSCFQHVLIKKIENDERFRVLFKKNKVEYLRFFCLLNEMLDFNPQNRTKPMDALHHPFFTSLKARENLGFDDYFNKFEDYEMKNEEVSSLIDDSDLVSDEIIDDGDSEVANESSNFSQRSIPNIYSMPNKIQNQNNLIPKFQTFVVPRSKLRKSTQNISLNETHLEIPNHHLRQSTSLVKLTSDQSLIENNNPKFKNRIINFLNSGCSPLQQESEESICIQGLTRQTNNNQIFQFSVLPPAPINQQIQKASQTKHILNEESEEISQSNVTLSCYNIPTNNQTNYSQDFEYKYTSKMNNEIQTTEMCKNPCESFYSKGEQDYKFQQKDETSVLISDLNKELSFISSNRKNQQMPIRSGKQDFNNSYQCSFNFETQNDLDNDEGKNPLLMSTQQSKDFGKRLNSTKFNNVSLQSIGTRSPLPFQNQQQEYQIKRVRPSDDIKKKERKQWGLNNAIQNAKIDPKNKKK